LTRELTDLVGQPHFGQFDASVTMDGLNFRETGQIIENKSPRDYHLMLHVLANERANRPSYSASRSGYQDGDMTAKHQKLLLMIICIISHSKIPRRSTLMASILSVYFHGSGVKRQVIETLSGLGLCHSYVNGNRTMNKTIKQ
ncbi:uncharacterized protein BO97DRAFT_355404, partial [Aspergillus homomorphus CBS 101889]